MPGIFIRTRREDTAGHAGAICAAPEELGKLLPGSEPGYPLRALQPLAALPRLVLRDRYRQISVSLERQWGGPGGRHRCTRK